MPFRTIAEAKAAGFPVTIKDVTLTPEQVNHLLRLYDAIKDTDAKEPMAVAIEQFKKLYEVKEGKWVAKKAKHADSTLPRSVREQGEALRAQMAEIAESPTSDYETEPEVLFRPGIWKGSTDKRTYTLAACKEMGKNAEELAARGQEATAILGHDDMQRMAHAFGFKFDLDGLPSLGDVRIWWDDKRQAVMRTFRNMPEKLAELMRNKRYTTASAEILDEWYDSVEGRTRHNVIPCVGILGAQWPGMPVQGKLAVAGGAGAKHAVTFAGETVETVTIRVEDIEPFGEGGGDEDMEKLEALQKEVEDLKAKLVEFEAAPFKEALAALLAEFDEGADLAVVKEKVAAMKAEIKTYKDLDERAKKEAAAKVKEGAEKLIDETLEKGVDDGVIQPSEKDAQKAHLLSQDYTEAIHTFADSAGKEVEGTQLDRAIALFKARGPARKFSESGAGGDATKPGDGAHEETPGEKKAREGFGYDLDAETGLPIEPKAEE